jgi:hypothetical protein
LGYEQVSIHISRQKKAVEDIKSEWENFTQKAEEGIYS